MFVRTTKLFLCAMAFTFVALGLRAAEAKTLYIVTIYGDSIDGNHVMLMKKDCEKFVHLFKSAGMPGGYQIEESYLHLSDYTQKTLQDEIGTITRNATSSDAVLLYIATHGSYYRENDGKTEYFLFPKITGKFFDPLKIFELMEDSNCKAKLKLVISDTGTTRLNERPELNSVEESDDEDGGTYLRGPNSSNKKSSDFSFPETSTRLQNNIDWLMESKGYYYVSSSIRGTEAYDALFTKMFEKVLDENNYYQRNVGAERRLNAFLESFENEFTSPKVPQRIWWEDCGPLSIPDKYRDSSGREIDFDHSKGVLVLWVQSYHDFCPAMQARLKKGDFVLGYILSDYEYDGETDWTYLYKNEDTFEMSRQMNNQKYIHLLVRRLDYTGNFYKKVEVVPDIDLEKARKLNNNDLKFGWTACSFNEYNSLLDTHDTNIDNDDEMDSDNFIK